MCYDSYVQLPEGIHLENLEHKHSIASKLQHIGLAHGPMGQSSLTQQRETGLWKELVIMCCNVLQLRSSFVAWACNLHQSFDLESTQNYSRLSRRCRKIAHDCRRNPPFCMPWNDVALGIPTLRTIWWVSDHLRKRITRMLPSVSWESQYQKREHICLNIVFQCVLDVLGETTQSWAIEHI